MTVCSVSVPHNPTANVAIQILTSAAEHEHQFILIDNDTTGLTAGLQSEGLTGSPLEKSLRDGLGRCSYEKLDTDSFL